jgi:hypothetical protein
MSNWAWVLLVLAAVGVLAGLLRLWKTPTPERSKADVASPPLSLAERENDALYQKNRLVARVSGVRVDEAGQKLYCDEIHNSDLLVLADECEYEHYRIVIRKVEHAAKSDPKVPHKGRVLRGIEADIVGHCQY